MITRQVVIYKRVSTTKQLEEGVSLSAQEAKLRAWCLANGHEVAAVYADEGISGGKTANRPGLAAALDDVTRRKGILAVASLSRMARSTKDAIAIAERLKKAGCELVSLAEKLETGTAIGSFFFTLIAALAELERGMISERVKSAMAHLKREGRVYNAAPYGYRAVGEKKKAILVPVPEEQAALASMRELRAAGLSYRAVAARLEADGVPTKLDGSWTATSVRRILGRTA